jgi:hypothetical protein
MAECLARPVLAERLIRHWYASDERFHGELKRRAETELSWSVAVERMREMTDEHREVEWRLTNSESENPQSAFPNPRFGPNNPELRGYYEIRGLPPGDDTVEVERIVTN